MNKPDKSEDRALFQAEVEDVVPLEQKEAEPYRRRRPPYPLPQPKHLQESDEERHALSESEVETHDYLLFARPGIQKRLLHDLQRGYLEVGLEVDLHGLTTEYARQILDEFLLECRRRRIRCARIIHGKGYRSDQRQPVLKQKVNYWLRLRDEVLAFCSATRRDGGNGAVYVLLRNPRKSARSA